MLLKNFKESYDYYCVAFARSFYRGTASYTFSAGINWSPKVVQRPSEALISFTDYKELLKTLSKDLDIYPNPPPSLGKSISDVLENGRKDYTNSILILGLDLSTKTYALIEELKCSSDIEEYYKKVSSEGLWGIYVFI